MEIAQNVDLDFIRTRAYVARNSYIEDMDNKLMAFEKRMMAKGFHIYWATDEDDLTSQIHELLPEKLFNRVCFDLPNVPEALRSDKAIRAVPHADVEAGTLSATFLFTQADFAIVETGTLVLLNKTSQSCMNRIPKLFIILDISKLINKVSDLETILYLKTFNQTEQYLPNDVKLIDKPFQLIKQDVIQAAGDYEKEQVEISIFLYDNRVTQIMQNSKLRDALYCIDCGRCKTVCPLHSFDKEITPIGLVRTHSQYNPRNAESIAHNALLCGNCDHVCPVQIPFSDLIIKELELSRPQKNSKIAKLYERRKKLNKMNKPFNRYFYNKRNFGKNKMLYSYFKQQKGTFYNILWKEEHGENE